LRNERTDNDWLRIHLLQQRFTLSGPLMEEMLIDGRIPDETTILNFRHLLEERQVADQILDVTIIHAPSSTKNKQGGA
jgi:IS5 family transposase